jgi:hypothetical protein
MKANQMLNEIKTLLNIEVKLEEQKLENGTVVSAEAFEKGKEVFIVTDDEKIAMPVGEYILEDGRLVVVEEEGIIADVREVSDEVPTKEEETEDLEEEVKMSYATKEELAEVKTMVEEIKAMLEPKEEMSEEVKEEEVKEELSSVKPIKHNPEASTPQKKQVQFAKGQFNTTLDRVLSKLNK